MAWRMTAIHYELRPKNRPTGHDGIISCRDFLRDHHNFLTVLIKFYAILTDSNETLEYHSP
jgi:hypothetical protein